MATKNESPYSLESFISYVSNNFAIILLVGLMFIGGYFVGSIMTENQMMKSGGVKVAAGDSAEVVDAGDAVAPSGPTKDQLAKVPKVTDQDHIRGNKNAKVMLIEYSDYECPFCGRFHPTMTQVMEEYGDDVAWVYRHYPLPFHPQAQPAAEASECVAKLGGDNAFWAYSDALYEFNAKAGTITEDDIYSAVSSAGISQDAVRDCVDSGEFTQLVKDQMNAGSTAGVNGTPGTILVTKDGDYELISGALPFEQVIATIEDYL